MVMPPRELQSTAYNNILAPHVSVVNMFLIIILVHDYLKNKRYAITFASKKVNRITNYV